MERGGWSENGRTEFSENDAAFDRRSEADPALGRPQLLKLLATDLVKRTLTVRRVLSLH